MRIPMTEYLEIDLETERWRCRRCGARPRLGARQLQGRHAGLRPRSPRDPPPADRSRPLRVHLRPRPGLVPDPRVLLPGLRNPDRGRVPAARPSADLRHGDRRRRAEGAVGRAPAPARSIPLGRDVTAEPLRVRRPRRGARRETDLRRHRRHVHRLLRGLGRPLHPGEGPDHPPQPGAGLQRGARSRLRHAWTCGARRRARARSTRCATPPRSARTR